MPSLIYITRVRPLSPEMARGLEAAGFHVQIFNPGEITADECLLVMTSEAVQAGLQSSALAPGMGLAAALPRKSEATEAAAWSSLKAIALSESGAGGSTTTPRQGSPVVPPALIGNGDLGFVPSQAGLRVLAASQHKAAGIPQVPPRPPEPAVEHIRYAGVPQVALPDAVKVAPAPAGKTRLSGWSVYKRYWQSLGMAAVILICAMALLASRTSIAPPAADTAAVDDTSQPSPESDAAASMQSVSNVPSQLPSPPMAVPPKEPYSSTETRHHISDYDFVAEDYTTHFDPQGHRWITLNPKLRDGENSGIQKRVVVN